MTDSLFQQCAVIAREDEREDDDGDDDDADGLLLPGTSALVVMPGIGLPGALPGHRSSVPRGGL